MKLEESEEIGKNWNLKELEERFQNFETDLDQHSKLLIQKLS